MANVSNPDFRRKLSLGSFPVFAILLIFAAAFCHERFRSALDRQAHEVLNQQWAMMKGYLRIDSNAPARQIAWYFDNSDPDEAYSVSNIQRVYLLADEKGRALEESRAYREIGVDSAFQISARVREALGTSEPGKAFWSAKRNAQGMPFLVRAGIVFDEQHRSPYYVAIGTPLDRNRDILWRFDCALAGVIALAFLLGWSSGGLVPRRLPRFSRYQGVT